MGEWRRRSDGARVAEDAILQKHGLIPAALYEPADQPPPPPPPPKRQQEPATPRRMSRDRLLYEVARALEAQYPDRAETLFAEVEDRLLDRVVLQEEHTASGIILERSGGRWIARRTDDVYRVGPVQLWLTLSPR